MSDLAIIPSERLAIDDVKRLVNIVSALRTDVFKDGVDFGSIPGTNDKPVLLLPGMEKLMRALHLRAEYIAKTCIEDFDKPLFFYRYECRLIDYQTGECVSTALGSANSQESKWAWRWVERNQVPPNIDTVSLDQRNASLFEFAFAVDKAETSGKYGKPADYWQAFKTAIANGSARKVQKQTSRGQSDGWEIGGVQYRIPNRDICDLTNTIDKIAQKRALSSAIKGAANVSMFFTVDIDDFTPFDMTPTTVVHDDGRKVDTVTGEIVRGTVSTVPANPTPAATLPPTTVAPTTASGGALPEPLPTIVVGDDLSKHLDAVLSTPKAGVQWSLARKIQRLESEKKTKDGVAKGEYYRLTTDAGAVTAFSTSALSALGIAWDECNILNKPYEVTPAIDVPYFEKNVDNRIFLELNEAAAKAGMDKSA